MQVHGQFGVYQDPKGLFCQVDCQPVDPQLCLYMRLFLLVELLVELHTIPVGPFLQPVHVPLDVSATLWCISCSSQFCVSSKLAEGTLCLIIQIINEDVKQDWTPVSTPEVHH